MKTNTTKNAVLDKLSAYDMSGCTLVAGAIHRRMKRGELTRTSLRDLSSRSSVNYSSVLYIPADGDHYIEFGITETGNMPMRFHDGKYIQLDFSLPSGKEKEFSLLIASLDERFENYEATQETVYTELERYFKNLES